MWQGQTVFSHLVQDIPIYDGFAMCLNEDGGILELGVSYKGGPGFVWTPIEDYLWYSIEMEDLKVNGKSIGVSWYDINWNGVIVDSGTTLVIVPSDVLDALHQSFLALCPTVNLVGVCNVDKGKSLFDQLCFPMTQDQVNQFPTLDFPLKNIATLPLSPQYYLWQGAGIPGYYCLGIQFFDDDLPLILGDVLLQAYHVNYDNYNGYVGFGPRESCPKSDKK